VQTKKQGSIRALSSPIVTKKPPPRKKKQKKPAERFFSCVLFPFWGFPGESFPSFLSLVKFDVMFPRGFNWKSYAPPPNLPCQMGTFGSPGGTDPLRFWSRGLDFFFCPNPGVPGKCVGFLKGLFLGMWYPRFVVTFFALLHFFFLGFLLSLFGCVFGWDVGFTPVRGRGTPRLKGWVLGVFYLGWDLRPAQNWASYSSHFFFN